MNRLDKIKLALNKGITCDMEKGIVYGVRGKEIGAIYKGYKTISLVDKGKIYRLAAHQFIYYCATGKIVDIIDHINVDKLDNRISNLRSVNHSTNLLNNNSKGYYLHKSANKLLAQIQVDKVHKYLGLFDTEEEASKAYITEKEKYIL